MLLAMVIATTAGLAARTADAVWGQTASIVALEHLLVQEHCHATMRPGPERVPGTEAAGTLALAATAPGWDASALVPPAPLSTQAVRWIRHLGRA